MKPVFLAKDDPELPDNWSMTVVYHDGSSEEFEVSSHHLKDLVLELVTKDDVRIWIPLEGVRKISFDKRFSKVLEIMKNTEAKGNAQN